MVNITLATKWNFCEEFLVGSGHYLQRQCWMYRRHQLPINGRCAKDNGSNLIHISSAGSSLGVFDGIAQGDEAGFNDTSAEDTSRPVGDNSIVDVQLEPLVSMPVCSIFTLTGLAT